MNSLNTTASGRADVRFQDIQAAGRNAARSAINRSRLWRLLPLLVLTCGSVNPVHANGLIGTIANGQTVTGIVTGSGVDSYTI